MATAARRCLILGIGSPFGADRAGWHAIELLRALPLPDGVRLSVVDRPGAALLDILQKSGAAILIDALVCDRPLGSLLRLDPELLAQQPTISNHGFGVADALALGRALKVLPQDLALIGISAWGDEAPCIDGGALGSMVSSILQEMGLSEG